MINKYIYNKMQNEMPKNHLLQAYKLFFSTLTSKDRLLILNLLRENPRTVTEIQNELKIEQTTVSHNLNKLKKCGFVKSEINGKYRTYSINKKTIFPLMDLIDKHMIEYCMKIIEHNHGGIENEI